MASKKSKSTRIHDRPGFTLIVIGTILVVGSLIFYMKDRMPLSISDVKGGVSAPIGGSLANNATNAKSTGDVHSHDIDGQFDEQKDLEFNLEDAMKTRTLGADDAPVKMMEFASLSCGHCAYFHTQILPALKKKYVDTGKLQLSYNDFPLNNSALEGSMLAHCVAHDQYHVFTDELFKKQEGWAFTDKSRDELIKLVRPYGLSKKAAEQCLARGDLKQALIKRMHNAARQWEINSTPSFLLNNQKVVTGVRSVEDLSREIDAFLSAKENADNGAEESAGNGALDASAQ